MSIADAQPVTREGLVEKVARATHAFGLERGVEYAEWDDLLGSVRQSYLIDAEVAVDTILQELEPPA